MYPLKKLLLTDRAVIEEFTKKFPPYSDFNFTSLWSYNTENDAEFAIGEDYFIIKLRDYVSNKFIYSFLTDTNKEDFFNSLESKIREENLEKTFKLVPETSVRSITLKNSLWSVSEDPDSFDYILSTKEAADLVGFNYRNKREHINQFMRQSSQCEIKISDCKSKNEKKQVKQLFKEWADQKTQDQTTHEQKALHRLLDSIEELNVFSVAVWDKDRLIGYAIVEKINEFAMGHFMKADKSYKNIYDFLFFQLSRYLHSSGVLYLNYEQDLGIEKLRLSKSSWHPVGFLKKYTIKTI